jgi:chromosomal replication initiator protein
MVDVQPPDLETKMAILDKKAEQEGIHLAEDVRIFIATKTKSNVRELEGALVKLLAYSSVTKTEINLSMAQQVLRHLLQGSDKRVTIETIIRAVADKFSLLTQASFPEIGRAFSGKHHTTVLHSVTKIEQQRQKDPDLNRMIHQLIDTIS